VTLDDVLALIEADEEDGNDKSAQLEHCVKACALLDAEAVRTADDAVLARVRRLVNKDSVHDLHAALTRYWVRSELALGHHELVAQSIRASPWPTRIWKAVAAAADDAAVVAKPSTWAFVLSLADRDDEIPLVTLASKLVDPSTASGAARFAELSKRSPRLAASAALAHHMPSLVPLLNSADDGVVYALRTAAERGDSLAAIPIPPDDVPLSREWATDLAYAFALSALNDRSAAESLPYATDARPWMRLGVVRALARVKDKTRLFRFVGDDDASVRQRALEALRDIPLDANDIAPLVAELERGGTALAKLLAERFAHDQDAVLASCEAATNDAAKRLAASLRRVRDGAPTRACSTCRTLRRSEDWSYDGGEPAALKELVDVGAKESKIESYSRSAMENDDSYRLLRCPKCNACYAISYWSEVDVNSLMQQWTLQRLTLAQVQRDFGRDVVPDWTPALWADLDHPDPHWRIEAAHELARDFIDAKLFERVESELLRHENAEVVQEALRVLLTNPFEAQVSAATLEALAASRNDDTRALALQLLIVQRGPAHLEEIGLDADASAKMSAITTLLSRGAAPGPQLAARSLEVALTSSFNTYDVDAFVRKTAFAPAHLEATRARLRVALAEPTMSSRALELCAALAAVAPLDNETFALVLEHGSRSPRARDRRATIDAALAAMENTQLPSIAIDILRHGDDQDARAVVQRLSAAHDRKEDIAWAIPALGANAFRYRESYEAAQMLWMLAKNGVDIAPAVADLKAALDVAIAHSAQLAARALVLHHLSIGDVDGALAVLSHSLPYVRGGGAAALWDVKDAPPQPIVDRLRNMTTKERSRAPRENAERALRLLQGLLPTPST
jgi:hypothetical protein